MGNGTGYSELASQSLHVGINAQLVTFGPSYRNAGVSRYTYTLLAGLSELSSSNQRYTAFVNAAQEAGIAGSPLAKRNSSLQLVVSGPPSSSALRRIQWEQLALPGELKRRQIEVFHSPVNVLPSWVPCPSVVTVHDLAFWRYPQYFRPAQRTYQRIFTGYSVRRASRVIAVSEATKRDLVECFHLSPDRIAVVYPVVDDDFQPCQDAGALTAFRARQELPERYILFLGTLEPRKNIIGLLEAYARLRQLDAQAPQLVIAGAPGWYYSTIYTRVERLNLEAHVRFTGFVSRTEQPLWYAASELFVYPSAYEGFGIPVAEALACGTPTITSSVSSLPEAGGTIAVQVNPSDSQALAYAMQSILTDRAARPRALFLGPKWTRRFSWLRAATACAQIYEEAARSGRPDQQGR
jgi:glycosyltransferase involved in cell wall biosynthesis